MKNPPQTASEAPKGEELPISEFDNVPDWNAKAWERIQAMEAKALAEQVLKEEAGKDT